MIKNKYKEEFAECGDNVHEFIKLVMKSHGLNYHTIRRRFYECRKVYVDKPDEIDYFENVEVDIDWADCVRPSRYKLMTYHDMKRLKKSLDLDFLLRHGFKREEVRWLKQAGEDIIGNV